jgi:enterochelin esterase family protein
MPGTCRHLVLPCVTLLLAVLPPQVQAQFGPRSPEYASPEVSAERKITFRIHAPKAEAVRIFSSDIPGIGLGSAMTKADNGIWETTVGPVVPGAYRYSFFVDGLFAIDPRNTVTSEANTNLWSIIYVPGSESTDLRAVPHGAVAQVTYHSQTLQRDRRMHVYTPPGYEKGEGQYPVLYLLHGATDCDASWSTVGRAGVILDNLIAAGEARPMLVVMPMGHSGPFRFGPPVPGDRPLDDQIADFGEDFVKDLMPHVESRYRIRADRAHRAIAGLSMGGMQTLNIAFSHLDEYAYVGVFSSGVLGIAGGFGGTGPNIRWEERHRPVLDDATAKNGLRLVWFACGKEDFLLRTATATVEMLKSHGFDVVYRETEGNHTWINWREYLQEFAPLLFQEK